MGISVRRVSSEAERQEVFRLRYTSYVEQLRFPMPYADHARRTVEEPLDATSHLLAAFDGGRVVGTVRISFANEADLGEYVALYRMRRFGEFYPGGICMTTRLVILSEYRKSTLPMRLMKGCYCDEEVIRRGVCFDLIDCKPHHVPLFRRFGYRQVMPNITNPFAGESHPMVLAIFDRPYLRRIGSPFARCRRDIDEGHPSVRFFYDHLLPAGGAAVVGPPVAVA